MDNLLVDRTSSIVDCPSPRTSVAFCTLELTLGPLATRLCFVFIEFHLLHQFLELLFFFSNFVNYRYRFLSFILSLEFQFYRLYAYQLYLYLLISPFLWRTIQRNYLFFILQTEFYELNYECLCLFYWFYVFWSPNGNLFHLSSSECTSQRSLNFPKMNTSIEFSDLKIV